MAAGFGVLGYDVDPAKNARLAALGGRAAARSREVARPATGSCSPCSAPIRSRRWSRAGRCCRRRRPGTIVLCTSTCDPGPDRGAWRAARGHGIRFLETPVSGTSEQVARGRRRRPDRRRRDDGGGGDADSRCAVPAPLPHRQGRRRRPRQARGQSDPRPQPAGAGGGADLRRALGPRSRRRFSKWRKGSASQSQVMETKGPKMLARDFSPRGPRHADLKDVHMMLDQAERAGPGTAAAHRCIATCWRPACARARPSATTASSSRKSEGAGAERGRLTGRPRAAFDRVEISHPPASSERALSC